MFTFARRNQKGRTMAENNKSLTSRERAMERLRGKHPDKPFDDDEAAWNQINDDYDDYDRRIGAYQEQEKSLSDMFGSDPRSAQFITEWRKGGDPVVELVRLYGNDIGEAIDDPDKQDAIAEANKEFVERVSKSKKLDETYKANLVESLSEIEKIQQERGLTDDQIDDAMSWLLGIVGDAVMGKFAPETIDMALKAKNYDADIAGASHEAEVRGRNAKIQEQMRHAKEGDGVAMMNGKNGNSGERRRPSIFTLAEMAR